MAMTAMEFAERLEESFTWWRQTRDVPDDVDKKLAVFARAINDLYGLFSHAAEAFEMLEGLPPGSIGRKLWLPSGLEYSGSLKKFG